MLSVQQIKEALSLKTGQGLPEDFPHRQHAQLQEYYRQHGFYRARLDSFITDTLANAELKIQLWIDEGPRLSIGAIHLNSTEKGFNRLIRDNWRLSAGSVFTNAGVEDAIEQLLHSMAEKGYALASVQIDSLKISDKDMSDIELFFTIDPGDPVQISSIKILGNELTKTDFILKESRLCIGMVYRPASIQSAVDALNRLGYFKRIPAPKIFMKDGQAHIRLNLEEANTYKFDGIVGYLPPENDRDAGYITGQLEFALRNLMGTGRNFHAHWHKKDRLSQVVALSYHEPWIAGFPVSATGVFNQEIKDSIYVRRDFSLDAAWSPSARLEIGATLRSATVLPDSADGIRLGIPKSQANTFSGFIRYRTMNDLLNPSKGVSLKITYEIGEKRHQAYLTQGMKKRESLHVYKFALAYAQPLFGFHILYVSLNGAEIRTAHADPGHQIRLGGTRTLRGYAEDAFTGYRAAWMNFEYRFLTGPASRLFLFVDSAYIESEGPEHKIQKLSRWGFGFGLRIETRLGIMGVDYGLGRGDTWMRGKIHVGLVNYF